MTAICSSYVHVSYKKAAFIPDASIGVFSPQFYNRNTKTRHFRKTTIYSCWCFTWK